MTTRQQILRSSTAGQIPAAGSRAPGELWVTFPDNQLGVIDTSRNAQKLLAVRYFSALASYVIGDVVVQAGELYIAKSSIASGAFNASQWNQVAWISDIPTPYVLPPASTTVLGGVKVDGTSITASGSGVLTVPASAVQPMNDNRIINGDMRIDQRNNGASGTATNGYTIDRWGYIASQVSDKGKLAGATSRAARDQALTGFGGFISLLSQSAYTPLATDFFGFAQNIEADTVSDFAWGMPNAQPVTLSFWAGHSQAGTYSGSIANAAGTRSYPFTYVNNAAWTKYSITIPGDTTGAWVMSGNAGGVLVRFDLGSGANFRGPAGAWASGNYVGVTGSVNIVATNGAGFNLTGVKLEVGSVATPFNRQSLAKSMIDCQRYYQTFGGFLYAYTANNGYYGGATTTAYLPVMMRAAPTVVVNLGTTAGGWTGGLSASQNVQNIQCWAAITQTTASANAIFTGTASAEL